MKIAFLSSWVTVGKMMFLLCLSLFFVSGDIFFVFNVGGFTVRLFQLVLAPVMLLGFWDLLVRPIEEWPLAFGKLLIWAFFVLLFIPNTYFLNRSIFYGVWLILNILLVMGITAVINDEQTIKTVLKWYGYSFAFSGAFGLLQIVLPLLGFPGPLVTQWWFSETFARINGFTYEPSYFVTYMITGWVMLDYLRFRNLQLFRGFDLCYWIVTASLLLSSSRLGWAFMAGWLFIKFLWSGFPWKRIALATALLVLCVGLIANHYNLEQEDLSFLVKGLGIVEGSGSLSTEGRVQDMQDTLTVFAKNPLIGVSLGGVAPAIARVRNVTVRDNEDAKANEGQCTTVEVLAASGIIGFIPYLLYMGTLLIKPIRTADDSELGIILKSLGWGFVALIVILQFNQTILRNYVWLHIGLLSAAYMVLRKQIVIR